jgi:hypothetical protein
MSAFFPDSERVFGQGRLAEEGAGIQQANPSCGLSYDWTVPASDFSRCVLSNNVCIGPRHDYGRADVTMRSLVQSDGGSSVVRCSPLF